MSTEIAPGITADPRVAFGKPVIAGTRLPVTLVLGQLAAGVSERDLRVEYGLRPEQLRAALRYSGGSAEERRRREYEAARQRRF